MNQEKIGSFISKKRKEKKLTQEALAEKLNVSKNAVSKWERGICLMDMSLLNIGFKLPNPFDFLLSLKSFNNCTGILPLPIS